MKNLAYIPSPSISSFHIGSLTIRFYAIAILLGICAAVWITTKRWKKFGGTFDQILDIAIVAVPTGIIGARIYHIVTTPNLYFGPTGNFGDVWKIWNGGLGIWGAVLVGGLCVWGWCRYKKYPTPLLVDALAPGLLIAQAIGRLGNYFNQELYGAPTTLPWGLKLNSSAYAIGANEVCYDGSTCPTGTLFHPTFLYEILWNLVGAALLLWLGDKLVQKFKAGSLFALYVMWYTAGRAWIEALRIDFSHEILGIRVNVWVSLIVFVCGVVAFVLIQRNGKLESTYTKHLAYVSELEEQVAAGKMTGRQLRAKLNQESREEHARASQQHLHETEEEKSKRKSDKELYEEAKEIVKKHHSTHSSKATHDVANQ
ncbi:prolipoprotein diacylglyceryl transferase [Alloscardovia venturai]|uniref:Phosphatidylglycerol--prolipoprotein diacylglyceryl transferase n=1 Tax=Alloscardovia venturai TaxID=1769421 RepID=A0ABW2Y6T4_9BIFI